jgi:hypothetical protein
MDSKKVIETLVRIATNQQKIINKLADGLQPPPTALEPATPSHNVLAKLVEAAPQLMALVDLSQSRLVGFELQLKLKPGANQATPQQVAAKANELASKNLVAGGPFTAKAV